MPELQHRTGDLFDPALGLGAIGHGVNLDGVMGSGIARSIADRWPEVLAPYAAACRSGELALGGFQRLELADGTVLFNLATQVDQGADARLPAIAQSVAAALARCATDGTPSLGIPRIGAGVGGLDWPDVEPVLDVAAASSSVALVVVTLPG